MINPSIDDDAENDVVKTAPKNHPKKMKPKVSKTIRNDLKIAGETSTGPFPWLVFKIAGLI